MVKKPSEGEKITALKKFMESRGLKPHPWALSAGIRSSTLYNFLAGKSATLSSETLEKLAVAASASVDEILGRVSTHADSASVPLKWIVGIHGRLFEMEVEGKVALPPGASKNKPLIAARVDGDGLHPVRAGWIVFFEEQATQPDKLIGKLAVVTVAGKPQQMIREIRKGSTAGLYTLLSWSAAPIEDVEVVEAHLVVSFTQPD